MKHKHSIEPMASFLNWLNTLPKGAITEKDIIHSFQRDDTNELTWIIKQFADEQFTTEEVDNCCNEVFKQLGEQFSNNVSRTAARTDTTGTDTNSLVLSQKEHDKRSHDASQHFKAKQSKRILGKKPAHTKSAPKAHTRSKNTYSARMWQSHGQSAQGLSATEALAALEDTGYNASWRGNR
jgi:hypothetical protein